MMNNYTVICKHIYLNGIVDIAFKLCAANIHIAEYDMEHYMVEFATGYPMSDITDEIEIAHILKAYNSIDIAINDNSGNGARYYRIANYRAYVDETITLIQIDE